MKRRSVVPGVPALALLIVLAGATLSLTEARDKSPASPDELTTKRLECPDWRVRYCLAIPGDWVGSATDRTVLERLTRDRDERVAGQASIAYLRTFVRVDRYFLRRNVGLYYQVPDGLNFPEPPDVTSVRFHKSMLGNDSKDAAAGPSLRVIGIIGTKEDAPALRPFAASENPYVAKVAAVAMIRLGHAKDGIDALRKIVERTVSSGGLHHQIDSLRLLAEVDPAYFERVLPAFAKRVRDHECTVPRHWWRLTRVAWSRGREVN